MARYLVIANQTLGADALADQVRRCQESGPASFHVVVPATHPKDQAWIIEGHSHTIAQHRLEKALARFDEMGVEADGEVGDARPLQCVRDALIAGSYDAVILSTLPAGMSRWLKQDLPRRIERNCRMKVIHVTGPAERID